jgi:tRNA A37 methylthiotransferase MiaB
MPFKQAQTLIIGLVQINSGARLFLPYVAGLLQTYVQTHAQVPQQFQFLPPLAEFESVAQALKALASADIVGLSLYIWNLERSLAIAQALKQQNPNILIIVGGPQVPNQAEAFLHQNPCIDLCVHGEGEATFLALLEQAQTRQWSGLAGVSYRDQNGRFQTTPQAPRRQDLEKIPSPYLTGVFEPLMAADPHKDWAILWETNRGCPFSCTFCDWGSATQSKVNSFDLLRLKAEIEWFAAKKINYIFCCDANFGILKRDLELAQHAAEVRQATGYPRALVVQNSKNVTDRAFAVHRILAQAGLDTDVTLSMQSLNPEVLTKVRRDNISLDYFRDLRGRLMRENIKAYTDMIIGLPGETLESFKNGICTLIAHGQYHDIHIFTAGILPNAEMAKADYRAEHGIESVRSRCVYVHTPVKTALAEPIFEYQELVVATATLPREDWIEAMAFGWLVHFLFFNPGTLRMAFLILQASQNITYNAMFALFCQTKTSEPLLDEIWHFFCTKARAIQNGDFEYCQGPENYYQGQWWWPQEYVMLRLVHEQHLSDFYHQATQRLSRFVTDRQLLEDCLNYSQTFLLLKHQQEVAELKLNYNIWDVYQGLLKGDYITLQPQTSRFQKPWLGPPYTLQRME